MGKQAATEVLAGAKGNGAIGGLATLPHKPTLKLVSSSKRQLILYGMLEAVGTSGYDDVSVRSVLDQTGLYRQAFYDHFPDKDACFLEAYDEGIRQIEALAVTAAASHETWVGKLRAGLRAVLDFLDEAPDVGRALIVEVHAAGPAAVEKRTAAMRRITDFIDMARQEGGSEDSSPPRIAAEGIVAGMHSIIHSRLSSARDAGFADLLPELMYFAVLPYFGPEAASDEMHAAQD
jgi:AcrR family transcriptional regulator